MRTMEKEKKENACDMRGVCDFQSCIIPCVNNIAGVYALAICLKEAQHRLAFAINHADVEKKTYHPQVITLDPFITTREKSYRTYVSIRIICTCYYSA